MQWVRRLVVVLAATATALIGYYGGSLYSLKRLQSQITAQLEPGLPGVPEFSLAANDGSEFSSKDLLGHWTFLYFTCPTCPDSDSAVLGLFIQAFNRLADNRALRSSVKLVFVSTERDEADPVRWENRLDFYHSELTVLKGTANATRMLSAGLQLQQPSTESGDSFRSPLVLIDPRGRRVARFTGWVDSATIANDIRLIADTLGP